MSGEVTGVLLIDKPVGGSSHRVVGQVRRALGTRRVGHAGTLDPAASGLLLLGVGAGTRLLTFLVGLDKRYRATIRLGVATTTEDADGEVAASPGCTAGDAAIRTAMATLTGELQQRPSSVSAVKVDGVRAYQRVRRGEDVTLPARAVTVHGFELLALRRLQVPDGTAVVDCDVAAHVSSGTYIRALARDLGQALGTAGHLTALRRTTVGPFDVADAVAPDAVTPADLRRLGAVAARVLPSVRLDDAAARAVRLGQRIPAAGEPPQAPGPRALLDGAGDLLAVAGIDGDGRWRYAMVVPNPVPAAAP